jgi:hypothetical protein
MTNSRLCTIFLFVPFLFVPYTLSKQTLAGLHGSKLEEERTLGTLGGGALNGKLKIKN